MDQLRFARRHGGSLPVRCPGAGGGDRGRPSRQAGLVLALGLVLAGAAPGPAASQPRGTPVLLTFDVEQDADIPALRQLDPPGSCTLFITGEFATDHPDRVRQWAARHEIACHTMSHPHLPTLDEAHQFDEIHDAAEILRKLSGAKCLGFRAPYLEHNADTREVLVRLGFRYQSSDWETSNQARNTADLLELPIASENAADYNLFEVHHLSDADATKALIAVYTERSRSGRPMVVLLHPYLIAQHPAVFRRFVDYVNHDHGQWTSFRAWLSELESRRPQRRALWVDVRATEFEPRQIAEDAARAGFTDLIVQVYDPDDGPIAGPGRPHDRFFAGLVDQAHRRKLRVHAWFPICYDPARLHRHPEWAMVDANGERLEDWICPTHADWRHEVQTMIRGLIDRFEIDGVHLDYLRFPYLETCQCPTCRAELSRRARIRWPLGMALIDKPKAQSVWWDYRVALIRDLAEDLSREVRRSKRPLVVSAAVKPEGALSFKGVSLYGQSYEQLCPLLDFAAPMAYHQLEDEPIAWVTAVQVAGQWRGGSTPIWIGVQAYQEPDRKPYSVAEFGRLLDTVSRRSSGVALFSYVPLFNRGTDDESVYNLSAGAAGLVRRWSMGQPVGPVVAPSVAEAPGSARTAGTPAGRLRRLAPAAWGAGGLALGALLTVLAVGPRRRSPTAVAVDLPLAALEALAHEPLMTGAQAAHVTRRLQDIQPAELDRVRTDALLLRLQEAGGSVPRGRAEEPSRGGTVTQSAVRAGLIQAADGCWRLTPGGLDHVRAVEADAGRRAWVRFVEDRLSESLQVTCPGCRVVQTGHWFRPTLGCARCHRRFPLGASPAITPQSVPSAPEGRISTGRE